MALVIGDNFSFQGAKPLDGRLKYDTLANMKAVGDSTMYDGCLAYCVATDKTYQWKSTNTVDTDLGKWREFSSGGGGGHAIEDSEGTALTQRDTMQFGDGFNATDDSENEKTVVEPNLMTAEDMDDVVTPLPSVRSSYQKYSTEEQIVGEWINGKPIYEKTIVIESNLTSPFSVASDLELLVGVKGIRVSSSLYQVFPCVSEETSNYNIYIVTGYYNRSNNTWNPQVGSAITTGNSLIWTFQYTKTTS